MSQLREFRNDLAEVEASMTAAAAAMQAEQTPDALQKLLPLQLDEFKTREEALTGKIKELSNFFNATDATGLAPPIGREMIKAALLVDETRKWLVSLDDVLKAKREEIRNMGDTAQVTEINSKLRSAMEAVHRATDEAGKTGAAIGKRTFGGFRSIGVYEINPADPAYRKILGPDTAQLSLDAITSDNVTALGDSSVMIVQETPGQFRVYQISNDPTQIMRNVALLVSKALAAASKYFSGGLAPVP